MGEMLLEDFPVIVELPVVWGDMDALQHINNVVYFRYFENARVAYFERIRIWEFMEKTGIGPILASIQCRFRAPLTYPDVISVGARVSDIGQDRFTMKYSVASRRLATIAAEGEGVLVTYDYRNKLKVSMPAELKRSILDIEAESP
ncbi:Thioesterase superfamily protein [Syntrophobacter sp. SbD1]|nr:Thioesterase superfamily protein [Syntrophobacter sp. SbD1]